MTPIMSLYQLPSIVCIFVHKFMALSTVKGETELYKHVGGAGQAFV